MLSDKTGYFYDQSVCSVIVKLSIERQCTEQAKQTPAKKSLYVNLQKKKIQFKKKIHKSKKSTNTTICRAEEQSFYLLTRSLTMARTNVILYQFAMSVNAEGH